MKNKLETIIVIGIILIIISFFLGKNLFPKKILILDQLQKCQDEKGEFSVFYNSFSKDYRVSCKIPAKDIYSFDSK
ncbi:MAG: hypothetical protein PHO75_02305 [Candidatus Shapirobacteria bacterium]|nr:hypothetical protein [Candidatus Shapirobacteria bacterium]